MPEILSGVFEGKTLGTPICVLVRNTDAHSDDYNPDKYRSGHADLAWEGKYGIRDYRGGGRASGRETVGRVIGGVVAEKILPPSVSIVGFTRQIGKLVAADVPETLARDAVDLHPTRCPDIRVADDMMAELTLCMETGDSRGGIVELRIDGAPPGLGEPVFHKAKALLASAFMSVGAVIGVMFGDAAHEIALDGKKFHDDALSPRKGISLRAHGIQGGITTGERIVAQVLVKPTATVGAMAQKGRHDPCIVPRIVPVLEAMAACVLADLYLAAKLDRIPTGG